MKLLIIIISVFLNQRDCETIQTIRNDYHLINSKEKLETFIDTLNKSKCELTRPYLASAVMQSSEYALWPTKKLKNFNKGKKMLEAFIKANSTNIEARYVRILVQSEIPKFLGYHKNIESDIKFIKLKIDDSNLPKEYKELILLNISYIN